MPTVSATLNHQRRRATWPLVALCAIALLGRIPDPAKAGVTPESPEVKKLVDAGLAYLDANTDNRLGGKCLLGLVFVKAGRADNHRVAEAIAACDETMRANAADSALDVYSNGLAVIFLCETAPQKYAKQIEWYLDRLRKRQKPVGGWGYVGLPTGDTSQTQYGAFSYWEAHQRGFAIDGASVDGVADWLLRTQDPDGCWGYQGKPSPTDSLIAQDETSCSMLAAGLGSLYICADLFGMHPRVVPKESSDAATDALPAALRPVQETIHGGDLKPLRPQRVKPARILQTITRAHDWMDNHYKIDLESKSYYYLYGLERYKSFQEAFEGSDDKSPKWYNDGYQFLSFKQAPNGSWSGYCGAECDTAFSILFLLRSTQKSIHAKLGEGMLLAGRGLPTNLSRAKLHNGQLIVEQMHTKVDELLSMIDDGDDAKLDDLARDPSQLVVDEVDEKSARRLQQLVRGGEPEVRLLAVRALGRTGNLDYVSSLLYALTDPDRRVVLEARDELRFISRSFEGQGPPDDFTEGQRFDAIEAWKKWYLAIRPTAVLDK
ncbi:MAG TPA: prenyltransferase/squalene oxidase repeat-containing protein [Lacipirellulaceae bacterium]|nr:prenyltransferase/squalene oxidase repeat-containing protein [Lacipirellulaceae bacterium]